jgi:transcriptional regulatory protein LevR
MSKEDLILQAIEDIKEDIKEIKLTMVTKEICSLKCDQSNKKTAAISSCITGAIGAVVIILQNYYNKLK